MPDYIKLVEQTVGALRLLSEYEGGIGVREIGRLLNLNKSTCHRLLLTLARENFVEFNEESKKYYLSPGILQLTNRVVQKNNLITNASV